MVEVSSIGITLDVTSITPLPTDALSSKKCLSEEDFPRFIPFSSKKYPLEVLAFSNLRRIHKADEVPSFFQPTLNTLKMGTIIVERQPESKRISFTFMKDFVWETTTEGRFLEEGEELGYDEYVVVGGQYLMQVGSIAKGARPLSNSQLQE